MLWVLWLSLFSTSSQALTAEQVLKTAWQDETVLSQEQMRSTDSRNPLRNVEAFASVEKEDQKREYEVGLKFQFRSWPEWKLGAGAESQTRIVKEASLAWALHERYVHLVSLEITRQKKEALERILKLSESYRKAQGLSLRAGRSTSKSFLGAQADIYKLKRLESVVIQEHQTVVQKIRQWAPDWKDENLTSFDLLAVEDVLEAVSAQKVHERSLSARLLQAEYKDLGKELEILRARENQWIKGMDVSQSRKDEEVGYKVELSIQLPGLGSDDLSRQKQNELVLKRALKLKEATGSQDRLQSLRNQIQNLGSLYKMSRSGLVLSQKSRSADTLTELENRMSSEQAQLDLLSQQQEILLLYVEYLLENERLTEEPTRNFLSRTLKTVSL
ncbi:hypothetical protein EZJ49_00220 [Bdellovibrio bacteriovorus]|uniref:hypothetical protein n=1 Tax=Bdellovibrio bacteriovorus TaxID=959 RepID=UPI0021D1308A|nr:hypothetical protein [Bdellovibrio bacteriovorus]UXR64679.1 hypothetical protein EZJ49_00220 [Bdellovibrio bacteriovorus]